MFSFLPLDFWQPEITKMSSNIEISRFCISFSSLTTGLISLINVSIKNFILTKDNSEKPIKLFALRWFLLVRNFSKIFNWKIMSKIKFIFPRDCYCDFFSSSFPSEILNMRRIFEMKRSESLFFAFNHWTTPKKLLLVSFFVDIPTHTAP